MNGLHNQFAGFELPHEIQEAYKAGIGAKIFGNRKKAKLTFFLNENKISDFNEVYDHYISFKPQRLEGESDAELKNRSDFSKVLAKYKPYFYNYKVYEKQ
jgi:hypothetical protein